MARGMERLVFTPGGWNLRNTLATVVAVAIVAVIGLVFDRAHGGTTPRGIVEVGELIPADALPQVAFLEEIAVTAPRPAMIQRS